MDFGWRRFTEASKKGERRGIYPLQYAEAAEGKDGPMLRLLRNNCPIERKAELEKQLEESRNIKDNKNYKALENARHSLVAVRDEMVKFAEIIKPLDTFEKYQKKKREREAAWRVVVEKQLELVSCWIHLWTEKGEKVAWHDVSEGGARECESMDPNNIMWWYNNVGAPAVDYEGSVYLLGVVRGAGACRLRWCIKSQPTGVGPGLATGDVPRDAQKLSQLSAATQAAVPKNSSDDSSSACSIQ